MNEEYWTHLRLDAIWFHDVNKSWWQDSCYLTQVFDCIQRSRLALNYRYFCSDDYKKFISFERYNRIIRAYIKCRRGFYILTVDRERKRGSLVIKLAPGRLILRISIEGSELELCQTSIIEHFIEFTVLVFEALSDRAINFGIDNIYYVDEVGDWSDPFSAKFIESNLHR